MIKSLLDFVHVIIFLLNIISQALITTFVEEEILVRSLYFMDGNQHISNNNVTNFELYPVTS